MSWYFMVLKEIYHNCIVEKFKKNIESVVDIWNRSLKTETYWNEVSSKLLRKFMIVVFNRKFKQKGNQ